MIGPDQDMHDIPWWLWPVVRGALERIRQQDVIKEQEVERYLQDGWKFVSELKSGRIIVEKFFTLDEVYEAGLKVLRPRGK
jgi:hypothetical protein